MKWYEKRGYIEDPLGTDNGVFVEKSINLQDAAQELEYDVEAGNMILIEGEKGTGKTTLLHTVIDKFGGYRKVVYRDCANGTVDLRKLMQNRYGLIGRIFDLTPKAMIVLLDNFKHLGRSEFERAKYYYDNNYVRSLVFAGNGTQMPSSIADRIGNHIIKLKKLTARDCVQLIKNRLGSLDFLPEKIILKIHKVSADDTALFLKNCSAVCEAAHEAGADVVSEEFMKALGEKN